MSVDTHDPAPPRESHPRSAPGSPSRSPDADAEYFGSDAVEYTELSCDIECVPPLLAPIKEESETTDIYRGRTPSATESDRDVHMSAGTDGSYPTPCHIVKAMAAKDVPVVEWLLASTTSPWDPLVSFLNNPHYYLQILAAVSGVDTQRVDAVIRGRYHGR